MRSTWLLAGKALQMGSGFLFWVVAARSASVSDVGIAAAAASAVMLCTQFGILGTGSAVIIAVGRDEDSGEVLDTAFTLLAGASVLAAGGYLLISWIADAGALFMGHAAVFAALFVVSVVGGTAMICMDQVAVAIRRTEGSVVRYAVGGVLALGAVGAAAAAPGSVDALTLLACWTLGGVGACVVGWVQLRAWTGYRYRPALGLGRALAMMRVGLPNQLLTVTERVPAALVPLILAYVASPTQTAYWYPAWMMAWLVLMAPITAGLVQFADGVRNPELMRGTVKRGIGWSLLFGGLAALILAAAAEPLLLMMGDDYAAASVDAVRILLLGLAPFAVLQAYNATCRALDRIGEGILVGCATAAAICLGTIAFGPSGTTAVAWVWLSATSIAAAWALLRLIALLDSNNEVAVKDVALEGVLHD